MYLFILFFFFFFNDTATTEIYTLSLHDALPISAVGPRLEAPDTALEIDASGGIVMPGMIDTHRHMWQTAMRDRKSTRLNSSHSQISYAVFCLKKKKKIDEKSTPQPTHHTHSS